MIDNKKINEELFEELELAGAEDTPFSSMTIRDFYCILHNVPKTRQKWLNDLIKENGRKESKTKIDDLWCISIQS